MNSPQEKSLPFCLLALAGALLLPASASAQNPDDPIAGLPALQVANGLESETFLVENPGALSSRAWRRNDDRADKAGRIPPPTAGFTLYASVVVETGDPAALRGIAFAEGAAAVEPVEGVPRFWLVHAASIQEALDLAGVLAAAFGPENAYLDVQRPHMLRTVPSDPKFPQQWHLKNTSMPIADANCEPAWDAGYTGSGVVVGVLEGGWQSNHPDLQANFNATASQSGGSASHGTSVAGVIAAVANNGKGVAGAAYNAQLSKQFFGSASQTATAFQFRNDLNDIKNNSWGPADDGTTTILSSVERSALEASLANGRGGLGEIFAWAAGNGGTGDRVEYDPYASSRMTLAIGAIGDLDTRAYYNETGSSMLVVAQSNGNNRGITTTDSGSSYTSNFGGTSSASPLGAGVVALMLDANPNLTWRDVQHVLIDSARKNDPNDGGWSVNGAGHPINYNYGFGSVDAGAATALAASWASVGPQVVVSSGVDTVNKTIPDNDPAGVTRVVNIGQDVTIEHVEVILNVTGTFVGDLKIKLTAPSGTNSLLAKTRNDSRNNYVNYIFTSLRDWDESSLGDWTLNIADGSSQDVSTWVDWELKVYGTGGGGGPMVLDVSPQPLVSGGMGSFTVSNGTPATLTQLFYTLKGLGSTFVPSFNVTLGLKKAKVKGVPAMTSDGTGMSTWNLAIPAKVAGRNVWFQAAELNRITNVVATSVN